MSEVGPRKSPEAPPEVGPEVPGSRWLTMAAIGVLLGMSERAARDWVRRHNLPTHGARPVRVSEQAVLAQMAAEERVARKSPEVPPEVSQEASGSIPEVPGSGEPIEAAYRVTPAEIEQAVSRTSAQYMGDLRTMLAEVGKVYEGQLAAKDAALTAKDQVISTQAETIADLRRRAEAAEAERDRLAAVQDAQDGAGAAEPPEGAPLSAWGRLRRWWSH